MEKTKINNFLVNCISDITIKKERKDIEFKCGETYLMEITVDNIKCVVKHIQNNKHCDYDYNNDYNSVCDFVFNSELYDGPDFHTHFVIEKEFDKTHASTTVHNAVEKDNTYNSDMIYGIVKKQNHVNKSNFGGPKFEIFRDNNKDILYGLEDDFYIDKYVDKYTTTNNLLISKINIKDNNKVDINKLLDFNKSDKLRYLELRNTNYKDEQTHKSLDILKDFPTKFNYPKNLDKLGFCGFNINSLDNININNKLTIYHSNISDLSFKKFQDINVEIYNISFDKYDNKYFETEIESTYTNSFIQIFKIDDDKYLTNISDRYLTKDETELMCSTWQFHEAMDIFGFDKNREFDLISYTYDKEIVNNNNFNFEIKDDKIKIVKNGDNILFFKNSEFLFLEKDYKINIWYNIKTKKLHSNELSTYDCKKFVLDDNTMATIIKVCEDLPFNSTFIDTFLNTYNIKNSKYLGKIEILDFHFDMINNKLTDAKCVGVKYTKGKGWYMLVKESINKNSNFYDISVRRNVTHYYEEIDIVYELIDFGLFGFELPTKKIDDGFTIMDHKDEDYYKYLSEIDTLSQDDSIELYNGKLDIHKVDETIKYKFNVNPDILFDKHQMMELDGILYKHVINQKPFSFEYFYDRCKEIDINIAEMLAKKYGFKLDTSNVYSREKKITYSNIQQITENKKSIINTIVKHCILVKKSERGDNRLDGLQLLPNNYRDYITTKQTHKNFETKFIKVKNNVYLLWNNRNHDYYKIDSVNGLEEIRSGDLFEELCENIDKNNEFSFVNLDIPQHVIENIDTIIDKNKKLFKIVFNNTFFLRKDLRDVGYIVELMTVTNGNINYMFEKKENDPEIFKNIIHEFRTTLKEYFIKLLSKNIEIKTIHEIDYKFIDRGESQSRY